MKNNKNTNLAAVLLAALSASVASAQSTGPTSSASAYLVPVSAGWTSTSVLSVGDSVTLTGNATQTYQMAGIPDGLGAYDNSPGNPNGTFTLLVNHEIGNTLGVTRDHGNIGAFVSEWIINKSDLSVVSGQDLIKQVFSWNTAGQATGSVITPALNRLCSADLPQTTAFYNSSSGLGSQARIFLNGEESGVSTGYALANVATGADKGKSYVLGKFNLATNNSFTPSPTPVNVLAASTVSNSVTLTSNATNTPALALGAQFLGQTITNISGATITLSGNANANIASSTPVGYTLSGVGGWENLLANPFQQDKTVVIGNNDGGTGIMNNAVAVYVGTKQSTGTEADKAGLTNGTLKFVNVAGSAAEIVNSTTRATNITSGTAFTLSASSSTVFSRPEDGAWNTINSAQYYFVTTDRLDQVSDGVGAQVGNSRLWRLNFGDITNPDAGGTIDLLIDGRTVNVNGFNEKVNMFDNITVGADGVVYLQEDVGGAAHNGKIWAYNPSTDVLTQIFEHDVARFGDVVNGTVTAPTTPFSNDEESSGIIEITDILGRNDGQKYFITSDQAHYTTGISAANVEGGQLVVLTAIPEPSTYGAIAASAALFGAVVSRRRRKA